MAKKVFFVFTINIKTFYGQLHFQTTNYNANKANAPEDTNICETCWQPILEILSHATPETSREALYEYIQITKALLATKRAATATWRAWTTPDGGPLQLRQQVRQVCPDEAVRCSQLQLL